MSETASKNSIMQWVHVAIVALLMFGFGHLPTLEPLTPYGMALVGIFLGAIYGWTVSSSGLTWVSLLAIAALGFTDFGTCGAAMAKVFSADTSALLLFAMLLLGPIMDSGVTTVIVAKLLGSKFCKGKPWNFLFLVIVVLPLLAAIVNGFLVALFIMPIIMEVFKSAGFKKGDKFPIMVLIGFFVELLLANTIIPWRGWGLYCTATFASTSGGYMIEYSKYIIVAAVFYVVMGAAYMLLLKLFRCDVKAISNIDLSKYIGEDQAKMTGQQKGVLIAILAMTVGCIIVSFFGGNSGIGLIFKKMGVYGVILITIVAMLLVKVDGQPLSTIESMGKNVMWDMMLVVAAAMLIANCMTSGDTGVNALLSKYAVPLLAGRSEIAFMLILAVVSLVLTNLLNNTVVMLIFIAVAGQFYASGIITNAPAALMVINIATMLGFYTPGSSAYGAMIHGAELSTSAQVYKYGAVALVLILLALALVMVPLCSILF